MTDSVMTPDASFGNEPDRLSDKVDVCGEEREVTMDMMGGIGIVQFDEPIEIEISTELTDVVIELESFEVTIE
jgi:hypothetical protein